MPRPIVLHVCRDWVQPSEGFVADVVRTVTATRAVVACGTRWPDSPAADVAVRSYELGPLTGRLPWRRRRTAVNVLLAAVTVRTRAALLHAHFGYWAPHAAAVAARLRRPWMVSLHGHDLLVESGRDPLILDAVRRAPLVVVPSAFLARAAVGRGVDPAAVRVIPSGLDLARLPFRERVAPAGGRAVVTFAGRFVEKKGVLDAADAVGRVAADHPDLVVRFVGYGPLEPALRERLAGLRVDAEIVDGARPGGVLAALEETDLLLTPSRTGPDGDAETLGLVNLEAQAMGVPVVTTDHGPFPETVSDQGAVLVPEGDVDALAAGLDALLRAPERWATMGLAGRRHVAERYELRARVADLERQYQALVSTGAPDPVV